MPVLGTGIYEFFMGPAKSKIRGWPEQDNRVVFDISGNKYRLVVHVSCRFERVLVKFVGTQAAYDRIDPQTV